MDIVTDLFDDSPDASRRRTVAAQRATQDIPLDPAQEHRVVALLDGHYTADDITAIGPALHLPSDYLHNAETTDTVDRQVTLLLLETAARLCGIGAFRICRGNFGATVSSGDPHTAMIQQQIQSYRFVLNPAVLDSIEQHSDTSGAERFDPRCVSVAWLLSTTPPEHPAPRPLNSNVEQNWAGEPEAPSTARRTAPSWWRRWFT